MGRLIVREFMMDCRNMFRGWKLVLHAALFVLLVFAGRAEGTDLFAVFTINYCVWTTIFMKPKLGKLLYLLPTRMQDRRYYILCKSAGIFIYNMLLYLILTAVIGITWKHSVTEGIKALFADVIPVFLAYGAMAMGNAYNWGKSRDTGLSKKYQKRYGICALLMSIPMLKAMLFNISELHSRIPSEVMIAMVILSYFFALICLYIQVSILWHTELSPENERKVEKLFS